eukprot:SAG11_NODE_419_length_9648_cov_6.815478_10_plen_282_part_00
MGVTRGPWGWCLAGGYPNPDWLVAILTLILMDFTMPIVPDSDRASVTALFKTVLQKCTVEAIDAIMDTSSTHERTGVDAVQVGNAGRKVTRAGLSAIGLDLAHAVLMDYVKPVVSAPELQYLFPDEASDVSVDTLASLLDESKKRVAEFVPPAFSQFEGMLSLSDVIKDHEKGEQDVREARKGNKDGYRTLRIILRKDSRLHQSASLWAAMILPRVLFDMYGMDISDQSRKRRIEREEDEARKRSRSVVEPAPAGPAAGAGATCTSTTEFCHDDSDETYGR